MSSNHKKNSVGILPPDQFSKGWCVHFSRLPATARRDFSVKRTNFHYLYRTGDEGDLFQGWEYITAWRFTDADRANSRQIIMAEMNRLIVSGLTIKLASEYLASTLFLADETDGLKITAVNANQRAVVPSAFTLRYWWKAARSTFKV